MNHSHLALCGSDLEHCCPPSSSASSPVLVVHPSSSTDWGSQSITPPSPQSHHGGRHHVARPLWPRHRRHSAPPGPQRLGPGPAGCRCWHTNPPGPVGTMLTTKTWHPQPTSPPRPRRHPQQPPRPLAPGKGHARRGGTHSGGGWRCLRSRGSVSTAVTWPSTWKPLAGPPRAPAPGRLLQTQSRAPASLALQRLALRSHGVGSRRQRGRAQARQWTRCSAVQQPTSQPRAPTLGVGTAGRGRVPVNLPISPADLPVLPHQT